MAATPILTQLTTMTYNAVAINGIMSISSIGAGSATEIPITTLASTVKEFAPGLRDFGSFAVEMIRNQDDLGQIEISDSLAGQETHAVVITLPSSTSNVLTFNAFVTQFTTNIAADGVVMGTATFRITSAPVYS